MILQALKTVLTVVLVATPNFPLPSATGSAGLKLSVHPDRQDHMYSLGDTAVFAVDIEGLSERAQLRYRFTMEKASLVEEGVMEVIGGRSLLNGSLRSPGFLRLDLTLEYGKDTLRVAESAGFSPLSIQPTGALPADYKWFWRHGRVELLRVPMDARVEHNAEEKNGGMRSYLVSLANVGNSRIYGRLTVPAGQGPFPAIVYLPGAAGGINEFYTGHGRGYAEEGMMVLSLNIHGIPLGLEREYYESLRTQGFMGNFSALGADDPYRYYYRRVVLGGVRAIDYLLSRPDVDNSRVAVAGGSQGGGLSLLLASIDKRIKALALHVPAMCDHSGVLFGRPTGWPHLLARYNSPAVRRTAGYFDGALAAGLIDVPALVSVSLLDEACPPTTVYSAYNNLRGPKRIDVFPGKTHPGSFTKQRAQVLIDWLSKTLAVKTEH
jgi:cephalosporin-C deacetylase-like acetyl esterase